MRNAGGNVLILDKVERKPLHVQIYEQLKKQILSGKLQAQTKLLSIRELSTELSVSRNTVEYAYQQLYTEGFIYSKPKSGYFVAVIDSDFVAHSTGIKSPAVEQKVEGEVTYQYDFHPASLAVDSFPSRIWRSLYIDCLKEQSTQFNVYSNQRGEQSLRHQIQRYLERSRGVVCDPTQLVICSGLQDSLTLIAQILREEHKDLAVEEPGYWIPRSVFSNNGFKLHTVPVQENGLEVDALKNTSSTVVYVTPSHQFPLGHVMSVENRMNLINWSKTAGGIIIEDDYDSELRYHGKPIPALQGLHPGDNIIYIGTFSKVLSPTLRINYMVLPHRLLKRYNQLFANYACNAPLLEQRTLAKFIEQGYWGRHLRKMRNIYKKRYDTLIHAVERHFGSSAQIVGQGAGLHIVLTLRESIFTENELVRRAQEKGIRILSLKDAYMQTRTGYPQFMLGFGGMQPVDIEKGVAILRHLI
jgi:GntR family transcriptional regulator/MocR family aminotransferase